ncbi:hypothetical protein [Mycobacterium sp.]|uniref:hypothetical protein n=1 Tax=Mycobacterium sp. TaxID=1785 RepID=UPI003D10FFE0
MVISVGSSGYMIRDAFGELESVGWLDEVTVREISQGEIAPLTEALRPLWDALDENAKHVALDRLEVVQEIITGYRDGHRDLARGDEPRYPFGPGFGISESRRCDVMAGLLAEEQRHDRAAQRRLRDGDSVRDNESEHNQKLGQVMERQRIKGAHRRAQPTGTETARSH